MKHLDMRHGPFKTVPESKWWRISCMALDVCDHVNGALDAPTFIKYMRSDLEEIKKLLDAMESGQ